MQGMVVPAAAAAGAKVLFELLLQFKIPASSWVLCTCRYGCKQEATLLLQEWVQTVGRTAGLSMQNTRLSSGSVGIPESRLEVSKPYAAIQHHSPRAVVCCCMCAEQQTTSHPVTLLSHPAVLYNGLDCILN